MNLQQQQLSLLNIIKSRSDYSRNPDPYLRKVATAPNLMLAKKIINWWRKLQVQNYCVLTCNLLAWEGTLDGKVFEFSKGEFSVFRDEVGLEFISFINRQKPTPLLIAVSLFEQALIRVKRGTLVNETIFWPYEPFAVIQGLLDNNFNQEMLEPGNYQITVSAEFGTDLFKVYKLV